MSGGQDGRQEKARAAAAREELFKAWKRKVNRTCDEHRTRLADAFFDWGAIDPSALPSGHPLADPNRYPPLPKLTYDEAEDWARYAWWLRHEAWHTRRGRRPEKPAPPFTLDDTTETLVFAPDYWQGMLREEKAVRDLLELANRPLPKVKIVAGQPPGWLKKEPGSDVVLVPEEDMDCNVPEEIGLIVSKRLPDDKEMEAVLKYMMNVEARYRVRIQELKGMAIGIAYARGREDAQPHVPTKSGPRADTQLERALHRHAMVCSLAARLAGGEQKVTRPVLDKAILAVAEATGCESDAVNDACEKAGKHRKELFAAEP